MVKQILLTSALGNVWKKARRMRILMLGYKQSRGILKAYLHGTTLSHVTSLRQAYDTNCIV